MWNYLSIQAIFYLASLFWWSLSIYCLSEFAQVQVTTPFVLPILLVSSNLQNKSIKRVCHCMKSGLAQKQLYIFELRALNKIVSITLSIYGNNIIPCDKVDSSMFIIFTSWLWDLCVCIQCELIKSLNDIVTLYLMDLSWRS